MRYGCEINKLHGLYFYYNINYTYTYNQDNSVFIIHI